MGGKSAYFSKTDTRKRRRRRSRRRRRLQNVYKKNLENKKSALKGEKFPLSPRISMRGGRRIRSVHHRNLKNKFSDLKGEKGAFS